MTRTRSTAKKPQPIILALAAASTTGVTTTTPIVRRSSRRLLQSKTKSSDHSSVGVRKNAQNTFKCSKPSTNIATVTPTCNPPRRSQRLLNSTIKSSYHSSSGSRENVRNKPDTTTHTILRRSKRLLQPRETPTLSVLRRSQCLSQPNSTTTTVLRRSQRILQANTGTLYHCSLDGKMKQSCGLIKKSSVRRSVKSISPNIEAVRLNFDDVGNVKHSDNTGNIGGSLERTISRKLSASIAKTGREKSGLKFANSDVGMRQGRDPMPLPSLAVNYSKSKQKDTQARRRCVEMEGIGSESDSPLVSGLEKRCIRRTSKSNKGFCVKGKKKTSADVFRGRDPIPLPSLAVNSSKSKQKSDKSSKRCVDELEGTCSEYDSPLVSELEKRCRRRTSKVNKGVGVKRKQKPRDDVFQGIENGWTKIQENALQKAYLAARPTPNFWKRVAKLVPGKSAQECFDKVNSENLTPLVQPRRSRCMLKTFSPQLEISFSETELSAEPKSKRPSQRKSHINQKMVRHLMRRNSHVEPDTKADLFSVLEPTVNPLPSSPVLLTPTGITEKGPSSSYRSRSLSSQKKSKSRFSGKSAILIASPPVLKPVKNIALHDKYVDQLHAREAKRRRLALHKGDVTGPVLKNTDVIRAAKESLISDARDAINKFRRSEIYMENSDDSEEGLDDEEDNDVDND